MTIPHKPFYFIRHGETKWNRNHVCMGHKDIPLNEHGIMQAQQAARSLMDVEITSIAASPLKRAAKTAEIIAEAINKPITFIDELKECGWGIKEGQGVDDGTTYRNWLYGQPPEGAESIEEFDKRILSGFQKALGLAEPVLIVAHMGVYMAIRRQLRLPLIALENCIPYYHRPPEHPTHPWFVQDLGDGDFSEPHLSIV